MQRAAAESLLGQSFDDRAEMKSFDNKKMFLRDEQLTASTLTYEHPDLMGVSNTTLGASEGPSGLPPTRSQLIATTVPSYRGNYAAARRHDHDGKTLMQFSRVYFQNMKRVSITPSLPGIIPTNSTRGDDHQQGPAMDPLGDDDRGDDGSLAQSSSLYRRAVLLLRGFDLVFSKNMKLSEKDRKNHLIFYALALLSLASNIVSLFVSINASDAQSCNIIIPSGYDDCCECVCDVKRSWCATLPKMFGNVSGPGGDELVPLSVYGNYFSGVNSVVNTAETRKLGAASVYALSLVFTFVQLSIARVRGNWYMLLCACLVTILQGARNLYLHYPSHNWNNFAAVVRPLDLVVLTTDGVSVISAVLASAMLRSLRPVFFTTQFQQFGHLTTQQTTLRHYNSMFAACLLDWQTSSLTHFQLAIIASDNVQMLACLAILYSCDVLSSYVAYTSIRYERYWDVVVALVTKVALTLSWMAIGTYVMWCYDLFRARALYLRVALLSTQYLGIDAADSQAYLLGECGIAPVVSGSGDMVVLFSIMMIAFFVRVISIFFAALLTADFGKNIITSLFFDVVAIQQKGGLQIEESHDTLDVVRKQPNTRQDFRKS
jgi:hypothetical protein